MFSLKEARRKARRKGICLRCLKRKVLSGHAKCRKCLEYDKNFSGEYYVRNKKKRKESNRLIHESRRKVIRAIKENTPCKDCGIKYPYWIMQFDHVRGKKSFTISKMMDKRGLEILLREIAKCDVVCSNCHADRTHKRL